MGVMDVPISSGPNDVLVGQDELGRPLYLTNTGQYYVRPDAPDVSFSLDAIPRNLGRLGTALSDIWGAVKSDPLGAAKAVGGSIWDVVETPYNALMGEPVTVRNALDLAGLAQTGGMATAGKAVFQYDPDTLAAIRAWHGSPHDFDRFSMDKIGTGEGAQAYGHGLYFADNRATGEYYKTATSGAIGRMPPDPRQFDVNGYYYSAPNGASGPRLRSAAGSGKWEEIPANEYGAALVSAQDIFAKEVAENNLKGRLYEVNIDANPEDFLDWDAPITDAPEAFQNWVRQRMDEVDLPEGTRRQRQLHAWRGDWTPPEGVDIPPPRVAEARNWLADYGATQAEMTDVLREAGIPGIRYLDAGSRGAGDGSRNYVVFDDSLVDILSKDGVRTPEGYAQDVLGLLSSGRADEVTDAMLDLGDPVSNARLNQYLFNNYDLPMDEASRMARAREMGAVDKTYYHETPNDFASFKLNAMPESHTGGGAIWLSDTADRIPAAHNTRVDGEFATGVNTMAALPLGGDRVPYDFIYPLKQSGEVNINFPSIVTPSEAQKIMDAGYTHATQGIERVEFNPRNIRSRFARFDPRLSHLSNLSAANASPELGALIFAAPSEEEKNALALYLEGYRGGR